VIKLVEGKRTEEDDLIDWAENNGLPERFGHPGDPESIPSTLPPVAQKISKFIDAIAKIFARILGL
jgi:hypothetical protein